MEDWFIHKATSDGFCINANRSGGIKRDDRQAYDKQRNSTPEGKIYYRVHHYNRNHTLIETPAEAKQKYLETGYIPVYIKNDDL